MLTFNHIVVIHEAERKRLHILLVMRGRFGPCPSPGLCRLDTFAEMAHTLCTPPGVHTGWRRCWLLYPYTPCRYAPPAGAAAALPWGGLQRKIKIKFTLNLIYSFSFFRWCLMCSSLRLTKELLFHVTFTFRKITPWGRY